jgi:molybdate/tungstate transport system permease protein
MRQNELFFWITVSFSLLIMAFILAPLIRMMTAPSLSGLREALRDEEVMRSIWLSIYTAGWAALISFILGTPLAYLLAREDFAGKRLVESIIDLPIVIPHPVVGIAILGVAGRDSWIGQILMDLGIRIMGSVTGIVTVLTFVGLPFYVKAAKEGFESVSPRLERVSRNLGASMFHTFFRITFRLAWRAAFSSALSCVPPAPSVNSGQLSSWRTTP